MRRTGSTGSDTELNLEAAWNDDGPEPDIGLNLLQPLGGRALLPPVCGRQARLAHCRSGSPHDALVAWDRVDDESARGLARHPGRVNGTARNEDEGSLVQSVDLAIDEGVQRAVEDVNPAASLPKSPRAGRTSIGLRGRRSPATAHSTTGKPGQFPLRVNRVGPAVSRSLPVYTKLRTYRRAARTDAMRQQATSFDHRFGAGEELP
jgi:hypothetical protein